MKFRIITASTIFLAFAAFANFSVCGQTLPLKSEASKETPKKRFTIYYHLGSVELPEGYEGYVTTSWVDAWLGYIESPENNFKISWAGGLVESLFEKYKKNPFWDLHLFNEDGLIIETWNLMDNLAIMQQIGLLK